MSENNTSYLPHIDINIPVDSSENYKKFAGMMQSMINILAPFTPNSTGTKDIGEFIPIFRNVATNLSVFAKTYLLIDSKRSDDISEKIVKECSLTDEDRFMLKHFGFHVGCNNLSIRVVNGIPDTINGDDKIVAKVITYQSLTNEERAIYNSLKTKVNEAMREYKRLAGYVMVAKGKIDKFSDDKNLYLGLNKARKSGWFDDIPAPTDAEIRFVKEQKQSDNLSASYPNSKTVTIDDIEQIIDEVSAGFGLNLAKVIGFLTSEKFKEVRKSIVDSVIDFAGAAIKSMIIDSDGADIPVFKGFNINVDNAIENIDGLSDIIKLSIYYLAKISSGNSEEKLEAVDDLCAELKDKKEVFENEGFIKLLDKVEKKTSKVSEQGEETVAAYKIDDIDDEKPSFLNNFVDMISNNIKEKPAFVKEANKVEVEPSEAETPLSEHIPMWINKSVLVEFPWIKEIVDTAKSKGVSLQVDPVKNSFGNNGEVVTSAITFIASKGGTIIPAKSFTIDLGYCLDSRIKIFANCKASGFSMMETCSEAFKVFTDDAKSILTDLFEKVFVFGFNGLNESDTKKYRMYNSNTMQLNKWIVYKTIPTGLVKGEKRQALKDAAFIMMQQLKEISRVNNIEVGRFRVTDFNKENLTFVLDNYGIPFNGKLANAPHMSIRVMIEMQGDNVVYNDKHKPRITYVVEFVDNVINTFKYPDGTIIAPVKIEEEEDVKFYSDEEPPKFSDIIDIEPVADEGTKPSFVQ